MKRVKAGCILQTLVFSQKPEMGYSKDRALKLNHEEFEHYKATLERARTRYCFREEGGDLIQRQRFHLNMLALRQCAGLRRVVRDQLFRHRLSRSEILSARSLGALRDPLYFFLPKNRLNLPPAAAFFGPSTVEMKM